MISYYNNIKYNIVFPNDTENRLIHVYIMTYFVFIYCTRDTDERKDEKMILMKKMKIKTIEK